MKPRPTAESPRELLRRLPFSDVKWLAPFRPQRGDADLRALPLGFAGLSLLGALLLLLPWAQVAPGSVSALDAIFLATSAVCVTGLTPIDVAATLTPFGQCVLLLLIQLGGVGIVTASLGLVMLGGQRLSLAQEGVVAATIGRLQRARPAELFRFSCLVVAFCESAGAAALFWRLQGLEPAGDPITHVWVALFHSVSAFCNAGLSVLPGGVVAWGSDPFLLLIVDLLVIAGGVGLLALVNLRYFHFWRRDPRRRGRITLQTKLAVVATLALLAAGTVFTWLFETNHSLMGKPFQHQVSLAFFHSAMARTAGFSVVDPAEMQPATLLATSVLMFIGGSPGSMAGGIKTVTFAVLIFSALCALRRQDATQVFGRRLPESAGEIALMVTFLAAAAITTGIGCLMLTELGGPAVALRHNWLGLAFEAVSAFGTVGLSTGVTPLLTPPGKIVVLSLMFWGRVGPLMLAVWLARPPRRWHVRHPEESVALG